MLISVFASKPETTSMQSHPSTLQAHISLVTLAVVAGRRRPDPRAALLPCRDLSPLGRQLPSTVTVLWRRCAGLVFQGLVFQGF